MPLSLARPGVANSIKKINGQEGLRAHLNNLGFVVGGNVNVVSANGGNLIVNVKDSRIALSREMAMKIYV